MNTKQEWETVHQPFELKYHRSPNFRWPQYEKMWKAQWDAVFGFAELTPRTFTAAARLLDVGCGSRPALDWFELGQKFGIDPLLDEYLKIPAMIPLWAAHPAENRRSQPAEERVQEWEASFDFVLCWNVLDHAYDPFVIVDNIAFYAKPGAVILLGCDLHTKGYIGHPGIRSIPEFRTKIDSLFTFKKSVKRGEFKQARDLNLVLVK